MMEVPLEMIGIVLSILSATVSVTTLFKAVLPVYNQVTVLLSDIVGEPNRPGLFERVVEIESAVDKIDRENQLFNRTMSIKMEEIKNVVSVIIRIVVIKRIK